LKTDPPWRDQPVTGSAPLTVTRSALYGLNVMGADELPERGGVTVSR
jgi:hypothetical protein